MAVILTLAVIFCNRLCPSLWQPDLSTLENDEKIVLTGTVYKTEKKTGCIYIYLKNAVAVPTSSISASSQDYAGDSVGNVSAMSQNGAEYCASLKGRESQPAPAGTAQPLRENNQRRRFRTVAARRGSRRAGGADDLLKVRKAILIMSAEEFEELDIKIGNELTSECSYKAFNKARNNGNYDEEDYYHSLGIFLKAENKSAAITNASYNHLAQFLNELRQGLVDSIYESVPDEETAGILTAICTGDRSGLTEDTKTLYQSSGIAHILAVSGLHISLIGMTIFRLIRKRFRFGISAMASGFMMLCFCIMSSASASSVRATIMFAVQIGAIWLGKSYDMICSLSLAAILLLVTNPWYISNSGFQLSFAALVAAAFVTPSVNEFFRVKKKLMSGFCMSAAITFVTMPIIMANYYEIPIYSIFLNVIVIPVMSVVLGMGILSAIWGMVSVLMGRFLCGLAVYIVYFIKWSCSLSQKLPFHNIVTGSPAEWKITIYYSVLMLITCTMAVYVRIQDNNISMKMKGTRRSKHRLRAWSKDTDEDRTISAKSYTSENERSRDNFKVKLLKCMLLIPVLACAVFLGSNRQTENLKISMLDVGQGECLLIESPSGTNYMVDAGTTSVKNLTKYRIAGAVKYEGIGCIDYMIVTHPDTDHMSAVLELLEAMPAVQTEDQESRQTVGSESGNNVDEKNASEYSDNNGISYNIKIKNLLLYYMPDNEHYQKLVQLAEERGVTVINIHAGMRLCDEDVTIRCIYPSESLSSHDANEYSLVFELLYGEFSAVITGDVEENGEKKILSADNAGLTRNNYTLLDVAHHGSKSSSSVEFINKVSPRVAIISAGVNNMYGHPHEQTLQRLTDVGALVYCTSWNGQISITAHKSGNAEITYKLEKES